MTDLPLAADAPPRMTAEQFLAWRDPEGGDHELVDGAAIAMIRPILRHQAMLGRLILALDPLLPAPWRAWPEVLVRVAGDRVLVPDLAISDETPAADARALLRPAAVIEILSPSNERLDGAARLELLRDLESLQSLLLVRVDVRRAAEWTREGDSWRVRDVIGRGAVRLAPLAAPLDLEALYAGLDLP